MPQDRRNLGRDLAFRGGTGVAAAAPEPTRDRTRPEEQLPAASRLAATADLVPPDTPLADIALPTQSLGDSLMAGGGGGGGGLMASVTGGSGALISASSLGFTAAFGFNVDLSSGVISGAWMNGSGTASSFVYGTQTLMVNVSGGAGLADSSGFTINTGFSGTKTWGGSPITPAVELFNTGVTLSDFNLMPTTSSVFVDYSIYDGGGVYDYGAGVGTLIK
jgi:hypothetical protein